MAKPYVGRENMRVLISLMSHLLSFYECGGGIVLDYFSVEKKKNEYSACIAILHPLLVKGRILTTDADIGYKGWCAIVHAFGGYYQIPIKNNHPAVRRKLIDFFNDDKIDRKEFQYHKEENKGHGRRRGCGKFGQVRR